MHCPCPAVPLTLKLEPTRSDMLPKGVTDLCRRGGTGAGAFVSRSSALQVRGRLLQGGLARAPGRAAGTAAVANLLSSRAAPASPCSCRPCSREGRPKAAVQGTGPGSLPAGAVLLESGRRWCDFLVPNLPELLSKQQFHFACYSPISNKKWRKPKPKRLHSMSPTCF